MLARKVTPEEVKRTEELFSICFDSPYNKEESPVQLYNQYINNPQNREQEHCLERFAAFEDDNQTMMSSFIMQPFDVHYDNHTEPMLSIGGVATLPQYRKRGGIRACFQEVLPYMYNKGIVFSYLYPFSTSYYRSFGYEICCKRQLYRLALSHIPAYSLTGSCYLLEPSTVKNASKDIPSIYSKWQRKYNMMVIGAPYDYQFIESANPYKEQIFTYVYRSSANVPLAYMTFQCHTDRKERSIECSRFFYINSEGLKGLLTLAKSFANDYRQICFSLPTDQILEPILSEWSMGAVNCQLVPHGMVRIIDAKKALMDSCYIGDGHLTVQILDPYIIENNGIFKITFKDNHCISVLPATDNPDITLPISAFSGFLTGAYDTHTLSLWENVVIHNNTDMIQKVFYKKPLYISTSF